jgi:hypothetical protein
LKIAVKNETDSLTKEELKSIKEENNLSIKGELEEIKEELEEIKGELEEIKGENNLLIKGELEIINGEFKIIKNDTNKKIKDELDSIKNTITHELRYQKNINLDTPNYLEYTLLYSLYITLSYINSRTINHVVIYSYMQILKIVVSVCIVQASHMNQIIIYQMVRSSIMRNIQY